MQRYYHYTKEENIERILRKGLRPGVGIGHQTQYRGKPCDNNHIYLAKNFEVFRGGLFSGILNQAGMSFLSVDLPPEHPIERDLDVYMIITSQGLFAGLEFFRIMGDLEVTKIDDCRDILEDGNKEIYDLLTRKIKEGDEMAKGPLLTLVATDDKAVKTLLSRATDKKWDGVIGFYRTQQRIPPNGNYRIERYIPHTEPV